MTVMRSRSIAGTLSTDSRKANARLAEVFTKKEASFLLFQNLMSVISELWPRKTAAHVAHFTGVSERSVRFWLALSTRMSVEHVVALLRTEAGYEILTAVMGDCQEEWWLTTKVAHGLRKSRRAIAAQQKRIDELRAQQNQIDLFDQ